MAIGRSCYTVRRAGLTWSDAQRSCSDLAAGSHLANIKSLEDVFFLSSYLLSQNNLLLLWSGLNDQQVALFIRHECILKNMSIYDGFNSSLLCYLNSDKQSHLRIVTDNEARSTLETVVLTNIFD